MTELVSVSGNVSTAKCQADIRIAREAASASQQSQIGLYTSFATQRCVAIPEYLSVPFSQVLQVNKMLVSCLIHLSCSQKPLVASSVLITPNLDSRSLDRYHS